MFGAMTQESEKPKRAENGGSGRPFVATPLQRQTALMLFGLGATQRQVAKHLGVSKQTIEKHFREEFEEGWELANLQLYGALWKKAVKGGNIAALIFLAKNRLGMSDRQDVNHSGEVHSPPVRAELCLRVEYRYPSDPRALQPPPPERLPPAAFKGPA
jgi:hypothetical protein